MESLKGFPYPRPLPALHVPLASLVRARRFAPSKARQLKVRGRPSQPRFARLQSARQCGHHDPTGASGQEGPRAFGKRRPGGHDVVHQKDMPAGDVSWMFDGEGMGHDLAAHGGRSASESWRIHGPRQRVEQDVDALVARHPAFGGTQQFEYLVVTALAQAARMKRHWTEKLGPLPCGCLE